MSFTSRVKEDLNRVVSSKPCCRRAEFTAFFLINGSILISGEHEISLLMRTENTGTARKMFTLAKDFNFEREIAAQRRMQLKKNHIYQLRIPPQRAAEDFLAELGMLSGDAWHIGAPSQVRERISAETCCSRAYLRGAFLAAGAVTAPEAGSYHLEISLRDLEQAGLIRGLAARFGIHAKTARRKGAEIVYLKGADEISDFLNLLGGHRSLLEFESVRVTKEVRNQANRLRNCDAANIDKTVAAAARQQQDIARIAESIGLAALPEHLRYTAELRLEYPEASLAELAEISALGRSALNHRLRRLSQIAADISAHGANGGEKYLPPRG